jgi:CcmD family protein
LASDEADPGTPQAQVLAQEGDSDPEANLPFLFAVYIITWGGFFAYAFAMSRRHREMQRELDALKAAIADKDSQPEATQAE